MSFIKLVSIASVVLLLNACGSSSSGGSSSNIDESSDAQYRVTFTSVWSGTDFSTQFPSNAHFSGLIGSTHNDSVTFWDSGTSASAGIIQVAETGSKSVFTAEIKAAQDNASAEFLLDGGGINTTPGNVSYEFSINQDFSLLTLISMVAPSPDWFVGVHDLDLFDSTAGEWIDSMTVDLKVYDAGSDSGVTFKSANTATSPQADIALLTSLAGDTDFVDGVVNATTHIGSFTFERIN